MSLRKEVADLKLQVLLLEKSLYSKSDKFHDAAYLSSDRMINSVHVGYDEHPISKVVQLILNHLNLKLERTPEKIGLVQTMNNAPYLNVGQKEE